MKVISEQLGYASISRWSAIPMCFREAAARVEPMLMGSLSGAPTQVLGVPSAAASALADDVFKVTDDALRKLGVNVLPVYASGVRSFCLAIFRSPPRV